MSEKTSRREAVANAVTWAARAQAQADILLRAEQGDAAVYEQQFGAGGRCGAAVAMANMWTNLAAVLDVEPAPEPVVASEEQLRAAQWLKDRDGDYWEKRNGRYHLDGQSEYTTRRPFEDLQREYGPLIIAEDQNR